MSRTSNTYTQGAGTAFMDTTIDPGTLKSGELLKRLDVTAYPKVGVRNLVDTTTAVVVTPTTPQVAATALTFTATVTSTEDVGSVDGTAVFKDGTTTIGTHPVVAGVATHTGTLASGAHSITVVYSGDAEHNGSTSPAVVHTAT